MRLPAASTGSSDCVIGARRLRSLRSVRPFSQSSGLSLRGTRWGRADDTFGLAGIVNEITAVHQQFLNDGGLGILVGDGQLPHPGPEQIIEAYYLFPVYDWHATLDYQFVVNPAYNRDRGPVSILGVRAETDF